MLGESRIDLLKLDIEGAELDALRGGLGIVDRVDNIIFEHLTDDALHEISAILDDAGFSVSPLGPNNSVARRSEHPSR